MFQISKSKFLQLLQHCKPGNKLFYHYVNFTIQINGNFDHYLKWIQILRKLLCNSTRNKHATHLLFDMATWGLLSWNSKTFPAIALLGVIFSFKVEKLYKYNNLLFNLFVLLWMVSLGLNQSPDMVKYMFP